VVYDSPKIQQSQLSGSDADIKELYEKTPFLHSQTDEEVSGEL
jgi:hypothetical protein